MSDCSGIANQLWKKEWLQVLASKKHSNLNHCKLRPETMTVLFKCMTASAPLKYQRTLNRNICQIHCLFAIYGCKCSSKRHQSREEEKDCMLQKKGSLLLNIVPYKEKNVFWNKYFTLDHSLSWASILLTFSYTCK